MILDVRNIENILDPEVIQAGNLPITGIEIDTRKEVNGKLFVAIRGENFDGHEFIREAFNKGASGAVVSSVPSSDLLKDFPGCGIFKVEDTIFALGLLGRFYRRNSKAEVTGITGSAGKTTVKDALSHLFRKKFRTISTHSNNNNYIGVPITLFRINPLTEKAVVELGSNHRGEIEYLSRLVEPDSSIITNIYPTHLEFLNDLAGVWLEKSAIFKHSRIHYINLDDPVIAEHHLRVPGEKITFSIRNGNSKADFFVKNIINYEKYSEIQFASRNYGDFGFRLQLVSGLHVIESVLMGVIIGIQSGIGPDEIEYFLHDFRTSSGRMEKFMRNGITFINDAYNSNPASFRFALDYLFELKVPGKKIIVCSDMLELGNDSARYHKDIGNILLEESEAVIILSFGRDAAGITSVLLDSDLIKAEHFNTLSELEDALKTYCQPGDLVLFKGSHGTGLYTIPEKIKKDGI